MLTNTLFCSTRIKIYPQFVSAIFAHHANSIGRYNKLSIYTVEKVRIQALRKSVKYKIYQMLFASVRYQKRKFIFGEEIGDFFNINSHKIVSF